MTEEVRHSKIIIEDSILGDVAFADYYRFGSFTGEIPLLYYIGGSISRSIYLSRLKGTPRPVVEEFRRAWEVQGMPPVALMVSSAPPSGGNRQNGILRDIFNHFLFELLPRTKNQRPSAMAFIGNSFGAHLASFLNFSLAGGKALATIAGCGMTEAARMTSLLNLELKQCKVFSNLEDGTDNEDIAFREFCTTSGVELQIEQRPGGHAFDDYRANGSLMDAFSFCLAALYEDTTSEKRYHDSNNH